MTLPPRNILNAALSVLHLSAYTTRNWTLSDEVTRQQINDLWEAIHEIPGLIRRWGEGSEEELLMYLDEYGAKWPQPNLRGRYESVRDDEPS